MAGRAQSAAGVRDDRAAFEKYVIQTGLEGFPGHFHSCGYDDQTHTLFHMSTSENPRGQLEIFKPPVGA